MRQEMLAGSVARLMGSRPHAAASVALLLAILAVPRLPASADLLTGSGDGEGGARGAVLAGNVSLADGPLGLESLGPGGGLSGLQPGPTALDTANRAGVLSGGVERISNLTLVNLCATVYGSTAFAHGLEGPLGRSPATRCDPCTCAPCNPWAHGWAAPGGVRGAWCGAHLDVGGWD